MAHYITEYSSEGLALVRKNVENLSITYVPGLSTANPKNPNMPRDRKRFLKEVLALMIESGRVKSNGLKFRFHSTSLVGKNLELGLGITRYRECADCRRWDAEKRQRLEELGRTHFGDSSAFFTKGCGIGATIITNDGSIFVGKRKTREEASGYSGELAAVNGWVDYKGELSDVDFTRDVVRELEEEYGVKERDIDKLIFSGIFSSSLMSDTDFSFLIPLRITDTQFLERYKTRKDTEHEALIKIASYSDMQKLLQTGRLSQSPEEFNLLFGLRASLEQIKPEEMNS